MNVRPIFLCLTALALGCMIAPPAGQAKERPIIPATAQISAKALVVKTQARFFDLDGYRPVSANSTMMCAETLRGTLDCKQWSAP